MFNCLGKSAPKWPSVTYVSKSINQSRFPVTTKDVYHSNLLCTVSVWSLMKAGVRPGGRQDHRPNKLERPVDHAITVTGCRAYHHRKCHHCEPLNLAGSGPRGGNGRATVGGKADGRIFD